MGEEVAGDAPARPSHVVITHAATQGDAPCFGMLIGSMPAKHSLHVVLTEPLVRYVRDKVAHGHYLTISDVVRASLRASIELEEKRARADSATTAGENPHGR